MISEALVIGALDAAIYRDLNGLKAVRLEDGKGVDCTRDLSMLLSSSAEKRYLQPAPISLDELIAQVNKWGQRHYLLKLLIRGMDAVCSDKTRLSCLKIAESLFSDASLAEFAQARLLGCALPESADLTHALELSQPYPLIHKLYQQLEQVKTIIPTVVRQLQTLLYFDFAGDYDAGLLLRLAVDKGIVKAAVLAIHQQDKHALDRLVIDYSSDNELKALLPRLPHLLNTWRNQLSDSFVFKPVKKLVLNKESSVSDDAAEQAILAWQKQNRQNRKVIKIKKSPEQALGAVTKQKTFILKLIRQEKISEANQAIVDLIKNQQRTGNLKHLCKSLCDLGSRITELNYGEVALKTYTYAQLANPKDAVACTGHAEALRSLGRNEQALTAYQETKIHFPHNAVACNGYAETLRSLGRNEQALTAYQETKNRFPDNAVACNGYAETLRSLGRNEEALTAYQETKNGFPHDAVACTGYAETLRSLGRSEEALTAYQETKQRFSNDVFAYTGYAEILRSLGRNEEALTAYQETKNRFPDNAVACNGYAETLRSLGRNEQALTAYQETKQRFSNDVFAYTGYAETLSSLGRNEEALTAYQETKNRFPDNAVAYTGYAETLRSLGRNEEALTAYQETKQRFSNDVFAYTGYAGTLRSLGRNEEALEAYQNAIKQFPANRVARTALACLWIELDDYAQGRKLLNSEVPQSIDDWFDYHVLAMSYLHEGNLSKAEEMLRYGVSHAPFASQQYFKNALGFLFIKQKQAAKALEHLQLTDNNIILFPQQALLYSHALAETDDKPRAQAVLDQVPPKTAEIIDFRAVLKQRYLTDELINATIQADLDRKIYRYELNLLLKIAA